MDVSSECRKICLPCGYIIEAGSISEVEVVHSVNECSRQQCPAAAHLGGYVVPAHGMAKAQQNDEKCSICPYQLVPELPHTQEHGPALCIKQVELLQHLPDVRTVKPVPRAKRFLCKLV